MQRFYGYLVTLIQEKEDEEQKWAIISTKLKKNSNSRKSIPAKYKRHTVYTVLPYCLIQFTAPKERRMHTTMPWAF